MIEQHFNNIINAESFREQEVLVRRGGPAVHGQAARVLRQRSYRKAEGGELGERNCHKNPTRGKTAAQTQQQPEIPEPKVDPVQDPPKVVHLRADALIQHQQSRAVRVQKLESEEVTQRNNKLIND